MLGWEAAANRALVTEPGGELCSDFALVGVLFVIVAARGGRAEVRNVATTPSCKAWRVGGRGGKRATQGHGEDVTSVASGGVGSHEWTLLWHAPITYLLTSAAASKKRPCVVTVPSRVRANPSSG